MAAVLRMAVDSDTILAIPTSALAQAWAQNPDDRYRLDYLMQIALPVPLSDQVARVVGELLGNVGSTDTTAAHCVHLAISQGWPVLTDDAALLRALHTDVETDEVP